MYVMSYGSPFKMFLCFVLGVWAMIALRLAGHVKGAGSQSRLDDLSGDPSL